MASYINAFLSNDMSCCRSFEETLHKYMKICQITRYVIYPYLMRFVRDFMMPFYSDIWLDNNGKDYRVH